MAQTLTIVAKIEAKADKVDLVKSELLKLIEPTRLEKGCIQYDLHQDDNNPELFIFFENWESRELLQTHLNNAPMKAYVQATEGAVASFVLHEMTQVA
ncbi:MAG: quinol monooxygenase YgiN [Moritella sp.]|jgi:quinol monooxygenase YgiN